MLADAAMVQEADARQINRRIEREHTGEPAIEPLYGPDEVVGTLGLFLGLPYRRPHSVAPGIGLTFLDAGHVLGSAITVLDLEEAGATRRVVFTGDLGRRNMPILRDPDLPEGAHVLVSESTYGDRNHDPIEQMDRELAKVLTRTYDRGGKVVIPSFALERAQELILSFQRLRAAKQMPPLPVYVDSPLAVKLTDVFRLHPECYDADMRRLVQSERSPFEFPGLTYVSTVEESKAIDAATQPLVVISGSGMAEGGRVLHHLNATIEDERNTVVIVGFQAQHTLGRRLVEKRPRVRVFGVERDRRAEVVVLNGFSAHAGQDELVEFIEATRARGALGQVALVHGEPQAQTALRERLAERGLRDVRAPARGERMTLA
jgi:metallo-beta-lactamase family protein